MKQKLLGVVLSCIVLCAQPVIAADPPAKKAPAKRAAAAKSGAKPAAKAATGKSASSTRARATRKAAAAPMVQGQGAATPVPSEPAVPKNVPKRAYAADGSSFYQDGRRIRIDGLEDNDDRRTEMAKQRLQKALDAGDVTLEPKGTDASGNMLAVVRVNGNNVADVLRLDETRAQSAP